MLEWKDFSAWVTIGGEDTVEYDVQISEEEKTVTCWIASEVGKTFKIHWTNNSYHHDTAGYIFLDGNYCGGKYIREARALPRTAEMTGLVNEDGTTNSPFEFSSLSVTDDDSLLGSSTHQDLGSIKLKISRVKINDKPSHDARTFSIVDIKVHERSKKGVTQRITTGKPVNLPVAGVFFDAKTIEPDIVNFHWKYRQIDVLRAKGIAPQLPRRKSAEPQGSPTPGNLIGPSDQDTEQDADARRAKLLREELREVEARMASRPDKKPRVKRESDGVIDLTQDAPQRKKAKVKDRGEGSVQGEVIDLT